MCVCTGEAEVLGLSLSSGTFVHTLSSFFFQHHSLPLQCSQLFPQLGALQFILQTLQLEACNIYTCTHKHTHLLLVFCVCECVFFQ